MNFFTELMRGGFLSLTVFTVLAQCAAGMTILKALYPSSVNAQDGKFQLWVFLAGFLLIIGLVVSLFHLNDPMRAFFALKNPFDSWLSLEIYAVGLFGIFLILCLFTKDFILRVLSGLTAGFMVFVMAKVYAITNASAWSFSNSMLSFGSTTLLLGSVALFMISLITRQDKYAVVTGILPKVVILFLLVRIVAVALLVLRSEVKANVMLMDLHITLTFLGSAFLLVCMLQSALKYMMSEARLLNVPVKIGEKPVQKVAESEVKKTVDIEKENQEEDPESIGFVYRNDGSDASLADALNLALDSDSETHSKKAVAPEYVGKNAKEAGAANYGGQSPRYDLDKKSKNKINNVKAPPLCFMGVLMFIFVIIGELAGRAMFYLLYSNTGL